MADPAVCGFLTKALCSGGGCLEFGELLQHVALPEQQLRQILEDVGQERFLMHKQGDVTWVMACSPARVCVRKECGGCEHLHLCKLNLMGRCRVRNLMTNHLCGSCDALMNHHLKYGEILQQQQICGV